MSSSLFSSSPGGRHSQGRKIVDQMKSQLFIQLDPIFRVRNFFTGKPTTDCGTLQSPKGKKHGQQRSGHGGDAGSIPAEVAI